MFKNIKCTIPIGERQTNKSVNQFIQSILEEDRRVKALRAQEIQSTAENPRIKAENDTIDISTELMQQKREKFLEEKRRQQLRDNTQELRQLQIQLQSAYVSKTLAEQKAHLDRSKEQQLQQKRQEEANIEKERVKCKELLREQEEKERLKKAHLRGVLQGQMAEAQEKRKKEYEEILKDKEEMTKIVRKIADEHEQEMKDVMLRREQARIEMQQFLEGQELLKLKQHSLKVNEMENFINLERKRDEEKKRMDDEKQKALARKQACSEQIGQQLYAIESEKRKRENLLLDLLVQERKAKNDFRYRQKRERFNRERTNAAAELESSTAALRLLKLKQQRDEDELIRKQLTQRLAEQDKLEQLKEEKKKRATDKYRKAILDMIEDNRYKRAADAAESLQDYEKLLSEQRKRDEFIEDERIRLLKSQPADVLRYLPSGVIRESDREILSILQEKSKK